MADDKEIRGQIYEFLDAAFVSKDGQPVPFRPNTRTVNDVLEKSQPNQMVVTVVRLFE